VRKGLVFGILLVLLLAFPALADTVKVTKTTADISYSKDYGGISAGSSLTITLNLPCTLESLNNTNNYLNITADSATASTTINLTVNGVAVATNYVITGGSTATWTFVDFANAGVNMSATKLTITIEAVANATTSDLLVLNGNDVPLVANYSITTSEVYLTKPTIHKDMSESWFTVRDTVKITQNSDVNLTNVKVTFEYPPYVLSKPITTYNFGTLNKSEVKEMHIDYQKIGPFIPEIETFHNGDNYTVQMKVYAYENMTSVSFEFDPTTAPWNKYFPEFEYDNIKQITLNGVNVSWERGSIKLTDLKLNKGYNTLNITYTKPMVAMPMGVVATPTPWYNQTFILPVWLWIVIAVIIVAIHCYYSRKMRR